MIKRLKIHNYRLFESFEMQDLGRINILSGQNNSGKSSLLECLFVLGSAGNPNILMAEEIVRSIPFNNTRIGVTMDVLWKSLFHRLEMTRVISIEALDTLHGNLSLQGAVTFASQLSLPVGQRERALHRAFARDRAIELTYSHNDVKFSNSIHEDQGTLNLQVADYNPPFVVHLVSPSRLVDETVSVAFGALRQAKRSQLVLDALRLIDPRIVSVEEGFASGKPTIWADVGLRELVPLSVLGTGMVYTAKIMTSLLHCQNGVLLIDELENGLHHSFLPELWRAIDEASKRFQVQVFATTHSAECVYASMSTPYFDDFRYHRLDRKDTSVRCVTYAPEQIATSAELQFEIR